jgi:hypothetical protein
LASFPQARDMTVARDFEEFFASCNKHGVKYLVVGGYAFALYAHPRYTGDMDLFVDHAEDNARRVIAALEDFGFSLTDLSWPDLITEGRVVQLGNPPLRIDLLTSIDGVEFEAAWPRRTESMYGREKISVISKEDLISNKRASGRKQDLADLDDLTL